MASPSRDRDRERLEQHLGNKEYLDMLRMLHRRAPFLRQFGTWADVIAFMRAGSSQDPRKDEVLRPIFETHGEDNDPRWRAVLMAIFWPGLESIHFQKRGWDQSPDERWQNIVWTFLQVLCRIDVKRRPDRLVQKVFNDTIHHLHDEYRRIWRRMNRESTMDAEGIEALTGETGGVDTSEIELREVQEIEIERLRKHLEAGRISEGDFLLLVGTRVYGKSVADYAREVGVDYQLAKKRRQRAEAVIRRFEEESR